MATIETVKVKHPDLDDGVLINKCDFDKEKHELWGSEPKKLISDETQKTKSPRSRKSQRATKHQQ